MLDVYDRASAANALGISLRTLDRYREEGKLPWRGIGKSVRFTKGDLVKFLDSCAVPATSLPSDRERLEMAKRITGGEREDTA